MVIENSKLSIAIKIIKQLIDEKNELQSKLTLYIISLSKFYKFQKLVCQIDNVEGKL